LGFDQEPPPTIDRRRHQPSPSLSPQGKREIEKSKSKTSLPAPFASSSILLNPQRPTYIMTNSHSQFPSSQIRRTAQLQSMSSGLPYLNQRLYQPLSQPSTTDLPSTIQRPRSAAPSRNVSSTSLSTLAKGMNAIRDRDREYWLPEYLEGTAYGARVAQWKEQIMTNASNGSAGNGSTHMGGISMRREASASHTVPSSRNPSPHHHSHIMTQRGVAFDVAEKSSLSTTNEPPFLPSRFNERDRCPVLELANDGMDAKFAGPAKGTDSDAASVRAEHPIPSSCGIYYYEVTIVSRGSQGYILEHTNLDSSVWGSVVLPSR
jgi:hypothetical protein